MGTVYQTDFGYLTDEGEIHAAAFDLLKTMPGFASYRKTPMFKIAETDLPRLSVYLARDRGDVDGGFASEPHFLVNLHLVISAAQEATDDEVDLLWLEQQTRIAKWRLLSSPAFLMLFEGVPSYDRKLIFTQQPEIMLAAYELEMVFQFRRRWPPYAPDTLNTVNIQTIFPSISTDPNAEPVVTIQIDNLNIAFASAAFAGAGGLIVQTS